MPTLTIDFTLYELASLRSEAARGDVPLKDFVHDAAVAAAARSRRVAQAAVGTAELSVELNKRLE
ncbi:antitoxin Phd [Sinomonas atrocyanea]